MPKRRKSAKRKRRGGGGSRGDTFPELIWIQADYSTVGNYESGSAQIPLMMLPSTGNRARVIEVTKIELTCTGSGAGATSVNAFVGGINWAGQTTSSVVQNAAMIDRRNFFSVEFPIDAETHVYDLTDENGKGLLYPSQTLWLNVLPLYTVGAGGTDTLTAKVYYRMKTVSMVEMVGLINQYIATT